MGIENELRYYDALKQITKYMSVESLHKNSQREYGLPPQEALEYAYENVIADAHMAIRGRSRPKAPALVKKSV
jgi:hypothetical protein